MKLLRVGKKGNEKPAIIDNEGKIRDLSFIIKDFNPDSLNHSTIDSIKELNLNELSEINNKERILSLIHI